MKNTNIQFIRNKKNIDLEFLELKEILSSTDPIMIFYNIYSTGNKKEIEKILKSKFSEEEVKNFIGAIDTLLKISDFDLI